MVGENVVGLCGRLGRQVRWGFKCWGFKGGGKLSVRKVGSLRLIRKSSSYENLCKK